MRPPRPAPVVFALLVVGSLVVSACAGDDDPGAAGGDDTSTSVTDARDDDSSDDASTDPVASTTTTSTTAVRPPGQWEQVAGGEDCGCADGSEFVYSIREADPTRVVFFLEGGGACFDAETCAFEGGTYTSSIPSVTPMDQGIFDADRADNPLADWSFVYVPYCTGDIHLGTRTADDGDGLLVQHFGGRNATTALDTLVDRFPDADLVLVAGASAGAAAAPLYGGLAADRIPEADITVMADSAGAYASEPATNGALAERWGSVDIVPAWASAGEVTAADLGIPDLYILAGTEHPDIVFARFDYAFDAVQAFFIGLAAQRDGDVLTLLDQNEMDIEAAGVDVATYVAPGFDHTVLGRDEFYRRDVQGTTLVDWLTPLTAGVAPGDVHCTDCGGPPA